jgi:hypothetical protein
MRVVAQPDVREHIDARGGAVFVWSRLAGCCRIRTFVLESSTQPPERREFELVHAADGFQVFTTPGLVQPDELHFEVDRADRLHAYWNGQGWIG